MLVAKDMEEPTPQKMWVGLCGSFLAIAIPLWILDMGGFFNDI